MSAGDAAFLDRIARDRTDLVFDWIAGGGAPDVHTDRVSLADWCAYYGAVSALRHLLD